MENWSGSHAKDGVIAQDVLDRAITCLGIGVANAINVVDPDIVVIGGGVSRAGDALFLPLRQSGADAGAPSPPNAVSIVPATLADGVGVLGAVALVLERGRRVEGLRSSPGQIPVERIRDG